MAYNYGYYPQSFYPSYQTQQPIPQPQTTTQSIIWVSSEAEAQGYPIAPNNAVALWDSSKAAIYLKQADASGRPTFKAFDLVEQKTADLKEEKAVVNNSINKEDIEALRADLGALMAMLKAKKGKEKDE